MMAKASGQRVKQQDVALTTDKVVPRDQIVKGYEVTTDEYVLFSPDEVKALQEKATESIDITAFVPLAEVDPGHLAKVHVLGPGKGFCCSWAFRCRCSS